jgi:UDP:flavonoid glycosyltransferase YjiC (YdhE family)
MVVKMWAPQVAMLRKESVGMFVTHCGWNSVLEAVVARVPMVACSVYAQQHLNMNVLVKDMKMAINLQREDDGFVSEDELERRARELMDSSNWLGKWERQQRFMMPFRGNKKETGDEG